MYKIDKPDPVYPVVKREAKKDRPYDPFRQTFPGQPDHDIFVEVSGPVEPEKMEALQKILKGGRDA